MDRYLWGYQIHFMIWFAVHPFFSVHCTRCIVQIWIILGSRPLWSPPPFLVDTVNLYFSIYGAKTIWVTFTRAHSKVLCITIVTSWSWMRMRRHCWRRQWLGRVHCTEWEWHLWMEYPLRLTYNFVVFSYLFSMSCYKRDQEGLPVHCGDQRHLGLWLGVHARAAGEGLRPRQNLAFLGSPQFTDNQS